MLCHLLYDSSPTHFSTLLALPYIIPNLQPPPSSLILVLLFLTHSLLFIHSDLALLPLPQICCTSLHSYSYSSLSPCSFYFSKRSGFSHIFSEILDETQVKEHHEEDKYYKYKCKE
jgi:hypothetical protein